MVFQTKKENRISDKNDVSNTYGRKFQVSPLFSFPNTDTVTTNGLVLIDFENDSPYGYTTPKGFAYSPFNNTRIVNNSSSDILVYPNQQRTQGILIAKGTAQNIDSGAIKGFTSILWENIDTSSITANQVRILVWKDNVTSDNIIKRVHKSLFGGF